MPHLRAFGKMNLQYEIRICHEIYDKGTTSKFTTHVTIFLTGKCFVFWIVWLISRSNKKVSNVSHAATFPNSISEPHWR